MLSFLLFTALMIIIILYFYFITQYLKKDYFSVCMCVYISISIYTYIHTHTYIYDSLYFYIIYKVLESFKVDPLKSVLANTNTIWTFY